MEVTGLQSQIPPESAPAGVARAPAPQLRPGGAVPKNAPLARDEKEPTEEQVQRSTTPAEDAPSIRAAFTRFRIDEATKDVIAQIVDESNEVIKQIPPEELLQIAAQSRRVEGLFFDRRT